MWKKGTSPLFPALFSPRAMVGNGEGFPHRRGRGTLSTGFPRGIHRKMCEGMFFLFCLRRPTFPSSWKSGQKSRKKPMVSSLPCALCCVQDCDCVPHVYAILPFSFRKRIVSAPAPLPLTGAPNSSLCSTVEVVSGSGARRKSIRHTLRYQPCSVNARYEVAN